MVNNIINSHLIKIFGRDDTILLGFENKLGYKYFCGDKKLPDKDYYTKSEIEKNLHLSGINKYKFYSVFPDLDNPQLIYSHDFLPTEDLSIRYLPVYNNPDTVFEYEEQGYGDLISNGLFHTMANSFLVECNEQGYFNNILQVTLSSDRGDNSSFATIIYDDKTVVKKPLYDSGLKKLSDLANNLETLKETGIRVIDCKMDGNGLAMPYVDAPLGNVYLQDLCVTDKDAFIDKMDYFVSLINKSASKGVCYFDFVPLNCFFLDNDFVFFDQEFALDVHKFPTDMLIYRTIVIVYSAFAKVNSVVPIDFFWKRYNIQDKVAKLEKLSHNFLMQLRHQDEYKQFNALHQRKAAIVEFNKKDRLSTHFYDALKKPYLGGVNNKKIYVFGSGKYAQNFIQKHRHIVNICSAVDNNSEKWGSSVEGVGIISPEMLKKAYNSDVRIIICVKDYKEIYLQLYLMGIKDITLYNPCEKASDKPYRIGYLSGVFDLYHIGHVNMFRRAKEKCDYLIVGVTSDEYVVNKKGKTPFIPCEERIAVVQSCEYVDKAVVVPYLHEEITEAWEKYRYDVQFCGSDYKHDGWWLTQKAWLEERGSTIVFFPYTQQTSSTKIKSLVEKRLL